MGIYFEYFIYDKERYTYVETENYIEVHEVKSDTSCLEPERVRGDLIETFFKYNSFVVDDSYARHKLYNNTDKEIFMVIYSN